MSILLEALRKSEKGQRPAEAPTIHMQQHMAVDAEPLKQGLLALLLVVSLLLVGWIIWHQYELPDAGYQPPVTLTTTQESVTTPAPETKATDSGVDAGNTTSPPSKPQRTPVENTAQRTPVENYQQPATVTDAGESVDLTPRPSDSQAPELPVRPKPEPVSTTTGNNSAAGRYPAPIDYWELPDSIRADVPEIKFSVLVYANQPDSRFVLVDGQRLGEGDSFQEGLVVEEIRRDGVVFSYRRYKFLVAR